ncbi:efflux RND transporter periplasmic adaptor subunit [Pelovirga terrestris]|uniref:Efflux RND transporter periplasmic adaptor subunit n=1 Tax=Pelovirga terrestris TaxID=2771352 RepID=A0A8J6QNN8_9BACT|nr:efflux RND transporter periplasmic adaptor subunit [Pelovirga terrestris]MBD1401047.1 efflux RND transporter periplasmic adaptor subunit [Pelovirga terrestris]
MTTFNFQRLLSLSAVLLALMFILSACEARQNQEGGQRPPSPVTVSRIQPTDAEQVRAYAGRVYGAREVEVRARVQGILQQRLFNEGEEVKQGAILFQIDPEPFQVALDAAKANHRTATATLNQAEREWRRTSRLYEQNAVSQREYDNTRSAYELAQANQSLAQSQVEKAQLELSYTRVEAPVSGVTGLETVSEGNLVERGTLLTSLIQLNPVHVRFSLPEADATLRRNTNRGTNGGISSHPVTLQTVEGNTYPLAGEIDFTASNVDQLTGTVAARAIFPNPDKLLVPGQFVRVQVLLQSFKDTFVIPETAVVQGPQGPSVFVIEGNSALFRPVILGPVTGAGQVVLDGLTAGDLIVINGQVSLYPGAQVNIVAGLEE